MVAIELLVALAGTVLLAGALTGVAGFGFALLGTMAIATALDPGGAVVFMIVPILAVNLSLLRELRVDDLRTCGRRFLPLIGTALVGTVAGIALLDRLPANVLRTALGLLTLGFVASAQRAVPIPWLAGATRRCYVESAPAMVGLGGVGGLVFGATNVGVQFVAYLKGRDLEHGLFVGVVALVFVGLNGVRVGAAGLLGLYPDPDFLVASVGVATLGVVGVAVGRRARGRIPAWLRGATVLGLLALIGLRLLAAGIGLG